MPRVSIIIPCYNAAPWIEETIRSALAQTHADREIIVIDDGSTDDSLRHARKYESREVRVVTQRNAGASAARNHGLRLATGDFIQFLDADDLLAPEKIAIQVRELTSNDGCIAAGPWGRFMDHPYRARFIPEKNWEVNDPLQWLCHNFSGEGMMPPIAWLTPRVVADRAGPWEERLSLNDDGEYFCRVLLCTRKIIFCNKAVTFYRSNIRDSLSRRRDRSAWESALLSHDKCVEALLKAEDSPRTRRACADLYQRLAFTTYPTYRDLAARCEDAALRLGGSGQSPDGGLIFRLFRDMFGWKAARLIQSIRPYLLFHTIKSELPIAPKPEK